MLSKKSNYDRKGLKITIEHVNDRISCRAVNNTGVLIEKIVTRYEMPNAGIGKYYKTIEGEYKNLQPNQDEVVFWYKINNWIRIVEVEAKPKDHSAETYSVNNLYSLKNNNSIETETFEPKSIPDNNPLKGCMETLMQAALVLIVFPIGLVTVIGVGSYAALVASSWIVCLGVVGIGKMSGCFVTTAAYGDANHPMVKTFRALRDEVLVNHKAGKAFIGWYEVNGPKMAAKIEGKPLRMLACRSVLTPLAYAVKAVRGTAMATRASREYMKTNFGNVLKNGLG